MPEASSERRTPEVSRSAVGAVGWRPWPGAPGVGGCASVGPGGWRVGADGRCGGGCARTHISSSCSIRARTMPPTPCRSLRATRRLCLTGRWRYRRRPGAIGTRAAGLTTRWRGGLVRMSMGPSRRADRWRAGRGRGRRRRDRASWWRAWPTGPCSRTVVCFAAARGRRARCAAGPRGRRRRTLWRRRGRRRSTLHWARSSTSCGAGQTPSGRRSTWTWEDSSQTTVGP